MSLIARNPVMDDVAKVKPDMIVIVALTDGKRFERVPVEVLGVRESRRIFTCRMLVSSTVGQLGRGTLIAVLANEILGIERESEVSYERA